MEIFIYFGLKKLKLGYNFLTKMLKILSLKKL